MNNNEFSFALEAYIDERGLSQERKNVIFSCMKDKFTTVNELILAMNDKYSGYKNKLKYLNIPEIINKILPEFEDRKTEGRVAIPEIELLRKENQELRQEIDKLKNRNTVLSDLKKIFAPDREPCHVCGCDIEFNQMIYIDERVWCRECFGSSRH